MPVINLHNHSIFSDGTLGPDRLADTAKKTGIYYFSLTDHDTMDGWELMENALKGSGICYCYGVEISCRPYENLHLLGYGINPHGKNFCKFQEKLTSFRARRADRIKEVLFLGYSLGMSEKKVFIITFERIKRMEKVKLQELLKDMSLEEKIMQLVQLPGQTFEESAAVTGLADMEKAKKMKSLAGSVLGLHGADKIKAIQKEYMENQ